jgi:hypothetical protein
MHFWILESSNTASKARGKGAKARKAQRGRTAQN